MGGGALLGAAAGRGAHAANRINQLERDLELGEGGRALRPRI